MEKPKTSANKVNEFKNLVQEFDVEKLRCPVTGAKAVAVCTNPKVDRKLVCTKCLVKDVDFVKKHRPDLVPIEDIKPRLLEAMTGYTDTDTDQIIMGLGGAKSAIMKDLLNCAAQGFEDAFASKKEEFIKILLETEEVSGDKEGKPKVNWLEKESSEFKQSLSGPEAASALTDLLSTLKSDKVVTAKLAITEILLYSSKMIDQRKEAIKADCAKLADAFVNSIISKIDLTAGFDSNTCILKRWTHLNQSYNYMNGLNSLLIYVTEATVLYGFSQYFTTGAAFNVKFKLVEGEFASGNLVVQENEYQIRNENSGQPDRQLDNISNKTFPVFLPKPIMLKPKIWYNISFEKPVQSHYIYYGSGPTQGNGDSFNFADGAKQLRFRRAPDDTIDNAPNLGQFPDFYLK